MIDRKIAGIVMAAGQGKRMQDPSRPKVLYPVDGKPMIGHVLDLTRALQLDRTVVIVGFGRELVKEYLGQHYPNVETVVQSELLGTGHAVQQTIPLLADYPGDVLVLSGDVPLLQPGTCQKLIERHLETDALATVLSVKMADPTGYGRIVRATDGEHLLRIVEERDASPEIRRIDEINSGIYLFSASALFSSLGELDNNNAQGEYYLTDVFEKIIGERGADSVSIFLTEEVLDTTGVNTREQLQLLEQEYLRRKEMQGSR